VIEAKLQEKSRTFLLDVVDLASGRRVFEGDFTSFEDLRQCVRQNGELCDLRSVGNVQFKCLAATVVERRAAVKHVRV
jgi:hypothetical protein